MKKFVHLPNEHELTLNEQIKSMSEFYRATLRIERQKYEALLDDYDELKTEFAALLKRSENKHNECGSGRKPISEKLKQQIIEMRKNGATYRRIANDLNLSLGTVHKVVNATPPSPSCEVL